MTRTENLNLPQWEASDPIRREDFNEAMARLDTALCRAECVSVNMDDKVSGDTIYTFDKPPKFVLLQGTYNVGIVPADTSVVIWDYISNNQDYFVTFQLSGTALIMTNRISARAFTTMIMAAFY